MKTTITYLMFFIFSVKYVFTEPIHYKTSFGEFIGNINATLSGTEYVTFTFKYGQVLERFDVSTFSYPWNSDVGMTTPLDCTQSAPICYQVQFNGVSYPEMSEDCLYITVVARRNNLKEVSKAEDRTESCSDLNKACVIFWIHGGGYVFGSSDLNAAGPQYFMDFSDCILVYVQYRLLHFGFAAAGCVVKGNMGLKDQNLALQWTNNFINLFGGNTGCIILLGQSAGAWSINQHMCSPMSKDLFHKSVMLSGSVRSALVQNMTHATCELASKLNCSMASTEEMVQCLKTVDATRITNLIRDILPYFKTPGVPLFTTETVEIDCGDGALRFVVDNPICVGINTLISITTKEFVGAYKSVLTNPSYVLQLTTNFNETASKLLYFNYCNKTVTDRVGRIGLSYATNTNIDNFSEMASDLEMTCPEISWIQERNNLDARTYFMQYDVKNFNCTNSVTDFPAHGDDVYLIFCNFINSNCVNKPGSTYYNIAGEYFDILNHFIKNDDMESKFSFWHPTTSTMEPLIFGSEFGLNTNVKMGSSEIVQRCSKVTKEFDATFLASGKKPSETCGNICPHST
ncbi:CES5A.2 family protein [Megaselia abdita]